MKRKQHQSTNRAIQSFVGHAISIVSNSNMVATPKQQWNRLPPVNQRLFPLLWSLRKEDCKCNMCMEHKETILRAPSGHRHRRSAIILDLHQDFFEGVTDMPVLLTLMKQYVVERKYFTCPSPESNPGRWIYMQTLYHVAVKAGFYR